MGFDITALSAYTEENADEFFSRGVLGSKVAAMMQIMTGIKSAEKIPTLDHGYDILQSNAQNCAWNDGGDDLVIAQRLLTPASMKIQEEYCVAELEPYFTQKILSPGGTYESIPPELRLMDIVVERINKVVELALVRGVLGGASAVSSFNLFDGILEVVSNDIAAGDIPAAQQLTGTLDASNIIASFRAMFDALPVDNYESTNADGDWVIYCSQTTKQVFNRAYQLAYGLTRNGDGFDKNFLDTTGIEVVSLAGFGEDSTQALLTRKSNWWLGTDIGGEETSLSLTAGTGSEMDKLFLSGKFKMGINTKFPDTMVTNNIS